MRALVQEFRPAPALVDTTVQIPTITNWGYATTLPRTIYMLTPNRAIDYGFGVGRYATTPTRFLQVIQKTDGTHQFIWPGPSASTTVTLGMAAGLVTCAWWAPGRAGGQHIGGNPVEVTSGVATVLEWDARGSQSNVRRLVFPGLHTLQQRLYIMNRLEAGSM